MKIASFLVSTLMAAGLMASQKARADENLDCAGKADGIVASNTMGLIAKGYIAQGLKPELTASGLNSSEQQVSFYSLKTPVGLNIKIEQTRTYSDYSMQNNVDSKAAFFKLIAPAVSAAGKGLNAKDRSLLAGCLNKIRAM